MADTVVVTFKYDPEEPDDDHEIGMSQAEYEQLIMQVISLGGYDMEIERDQP